MFEDTKKFMKREEMMGNQKILIPHNLPTLGKKLVVNSSIPRVLSSAMSFNTFLISRLVTCKLRISLIAVGKGN